MTGSSARVGWKEGLVRFSRSWRSDDVRADLPGHILERCELLLIDQIELCDEVVEVLIAGVHMRFGA